MCFPDPGWFPQPNRFPQPVNWSGGRCMECGRFLPNGLVPYRPYWQHHLPGEPRCRSCGGIMDGSPPSFPLPHRVMSSPMSPSGRGYDHYPRAMPPAMPLPVGCPPQVFCESGHFC